MKSTLLNESHFQSLLLYSYEVFCELAAERLAVASYYCKKERTNKCIFLVLTKIHCLIHFRSSITLGYVCQKKSRKLTGPLNRKSIKSKLDCNRVSVLLEFDC